ncbi:MAG: NADH dehydrogenase FAD-containing subunit [Kiritimatiellae bacterium]|nr:NADH dehydrogenase FAD-containing subunit [Kiritimatiellia bacterium]
METTVIKELLKFLTPLLFVANLVQSFFYLPQADLREGGNHMPHRLYYTLIILFFGSMMFAILAPSLPLMWVAVELTTLVSAPLIAYYRNENSLEAMWKYLLICSIGIAFALFGTMLVLHAQAIGNIRWHMAGFAFILAGYGTKMGLAPFHSWLPDAHSEAPAPVSALLSGALLNCSFFAIVRFRETMPAEAAPFCDNAMLFLGLFSIAVGAVFMVRQTDYKRILAYSSVEHMGLITVFYAVYGMHGNERLSGILFAALLLHIAAHSLTKTILFQIAGNLLLAFHTRAVSVVQGLGANMRGHAAIWLTGFVLICGMPPSLLFVSELAMVIAAPVWVSATVLALLFIVFSAMMKACLTMVMGKPVSNHNPIPKRLLAVPAILLSLLVVAGSYMCVCLAIISKGGL